MAASVSLRTEIFQWSEYPPSVVLIGTAPYPPFETGTRLCWVPVAGGSAAEPPVVMA